MLTEDANSGYQLFTKIGEKYGIVCIPAAGKDNIKQKIFLMKSEKVLVIADGAAFGPQMNDIYRLMQEDNAKFSLYLPESLEWLLLKADLLGQPDILEILQHPADFIESSEFFSWERFFTNLLEQRTKDISYVRYDKAKLPEFYLQEENWRRSLRRWGKTHWKFTNNVSCCSERSAILAPAQAAIKNREHKNFIASYR